MRDKLREGKDPLTERGAAKAKAKADAAKAKAGAMTFAQVADMFIAAHEAGWRSHRHTDAWRNTLRLIPGLVVAPDHRLDGQAVVDGLSKRFLKPEAGMWCRASAYARPDGRWVDGARAGVVGVVRSGLVRRSVGAAAGAAPGADSSERPPAWDVAEARRVAARRRLERSEAADAVTSRSIQ